jgi:pSer/pThr/pTyr-binding forkhead associated (FHA) protein
MSAKLICLKGPYAGQEFPIEGHGIVLGRDPESASVILDVSSVSRSHANIFLAQDGRVILQDLRSTNGTFLIDSGGEKTRIQGDVVLADGQRFSLSANDDIVFEISGSEQANQPEASSLAEPTRVYSGAPVPPPIPSAPPASPASAPPASWPPAQPAPGPAGSFSSAPGDGAMRGTSNAPLILGIIGSVLMIPGILCSACAGGIGGALASGSSGFESGLVKGTLFGLLPIILGFAGAAEGKSNPTLSFIFLLIAALIAGFRWTTTFFTDLFYLAALILYLIGAIMALAQKKEPADAG